MSEEMKKGAFNLFAQSQMTYSEAEEKAKQEAGKPKVERFRIGEDGEYPIRILPIAPVIDAEGNPLPLDRKGYEYPLHQLFLGITLPAKKGKKERKINIPVVRTTDKGIDKSIDLIDTYVRIAKEMYAKDEDLLKKITSNSFSGGLRWSYQHAMYVIDLSNDKTRAKGPQLWQCSHSQYKTIDDAKMRLWQELRSDGEQNTCPISWFTDAYPVKVIRKTEERKTDYTIEIGRKCVDVTEEEVEKLLSLPRIPDEINRFTRYQLEAEIVFLQQYDELNETEICSQSDFVEAVEKLKGEMPSDDTSHFDLASADTEKNAASKDTIDSLWAEYDKIADAGLSERSEEYQELREKIRQFAEDNELDVRLSRSKNNKQLLEEIEEVMDEKSSGKASVAEQKSVDEVNNEDEEPDNDDDKDEAPAPIERKRRPRPSLNDAEDDKPQVAEPETVQPVAAENSEPTIRRRRRRS